LPEVAAAHLKALDHQIQTLRLRRAVLRTAVKTTTTPEEVALMHRLATISEVERQHLIDDFLDDTFGETTANPELAMLRPMRPELPDDPERHQVEAWGWNLPNSSRTQTSWLVLAASPSTKQLNATRGSDGSAP
jgi:hypothetical protein